MGVLVAAMLATSALFIMAREILQTIHWAVRVGRLEAVIACLPNAPPPPPPPSPFPWRLHEEWNHILSYPGCCCGHPQPFMMYLIHFEQDCSQPCDESWGLQIHPSFMTGGLHTQFLGEADHGLSISFPLNLQRESTSTRVTSLHAGCSRCQTGYEYIRLGSPAKHIVQWTGITRSVA